MTNVLLLGAGFSANWDVPLARQFFDWLTGIPEVGNDTALKEILWRYKDHGGFESALSEVQAAYVNSRSEETRRRLDKFQTAVNQIFSEIDSGLGQRTGWDFNHDVGSRLVDFLIRFDAIFTLNQDLLFERFYMNNNVMLASMQKWNGCVLPGMRMHPNSDYPLDFARTTWTPDENNFVVGARDQPYFKLHGSYRWKNANGGDLMVMGGGKGQALREHRVLQWYQSEFSRILKLGAARLMVVGYGFGDAHINEVILGAEPSGIRMFIVDPLGVDVADPTRSLPLRMPNPFKNIIESASQVPFSQTFRDNVIERKRLERFLS